MAAIEVVHTLQDAGITLEHPLEVILFQNEGVKLSWFIGGGGWVGLFQGNRAYREFVVPGIVYGVYGSPLFLAVIEAERNLREAELREHEMLTEFHRRQAMLDRLLGRLPDGVTRPEEGGSR